MSHHIDSDRNGFLWHGDRTCRSQESEIRRMTFGEVGLKKNVVKNLKEHQGGFVLCCLFPGV